MMRPVETAAFMAGAMRRIRELEERDRCEGSLYEFLRAAWPHFDPADFTGNWHLEAICEHLEAVALGQIRRLLINVPPRSGKTSCVSIAFPSWIWAQMKDIDYPLLGPQVSLFYASYAESLSREHSLKTRRLIESRWFQRLWGDRFKLMVDRNNALHFETDKGGHRFATSVDARAAGFGGDILLADDPHLVKEAESEVQRENVIRWWTETMPSRLNDRRTGAMVIIMQRVHEGDLSGYVISNDLGYEHLMLPMTCDERRIMVDGHRYETATGFSDPREDGELLWPERITPDDLIVLQKELGPYGFHGQYEQSPAPRGGGIIKEDWWLPWDKETAAKFGTIENKYPPFEFVLASLDTALTEKTENDPSALSIWGVFRDKQGNPKVMLVICWHEWLQIHDLVRRVRGDCVTNNVDRLIIEDKAAGHSVGQELRRMFNDAAFGIELVNPRTGFVKSPDKVARVHSVVHLFAEGLIFAPDKEWADLMIQECSVFPRGTHDDLVDSMSQAMLFLRRNNLLLRGDEQSALAADEVAFRSRAQPLYEA